MTAKFKKYKKKINKLNIKIKLFFNFIPFSQKTTTYLFRVDQMGKIIFHTVDQLGVDQLGVDQLGVDQLGVDQLGCYHDKVPTHGCFLQCLYFMS